MNKTAVPISASCVANKDPFSDRVISFDSFENCPGWDQAETWVLGLIEKYGCRSILEVGSGANPTLSARTVSELGLHYVANDISASELEKADDVFDQWVGDVSREKIPADMESTFDLVFSRMVNEHVKDGHSYHTNINRLLCTGGISAHCFATLYSFPFLANWLLPESISDILVRIAKPERDRYKQNKFPAYYSWSRGPSKEMIHNLESVGFDVLTYVGYFGHQYYERIPFLHWLEMKKTARLVAKPIGQFTSFAMLVAQKRA